MIGDMDSIRAFSDFCVGDLAVFRQSFDASDFQAFSALSGDRNPLHHDEGYAAESRFGRPIVPVHMTIAPLSRVAGMVFPGDPSLYLGHEVRSILPVHYGETLTYSARIKAVHPELRTLTIRVLAMRGSDVVLDAEMRVMSRLESWAAAPLQSDLLPSKGRILITGATGEIGTALARAVARRGWPLLLVDRGPGPKRDRLEALLKPLIASSDGVEFLACDLTSNAEVDELCLRLETRADVAALFHTASPPIDAPLHDLVQVNYAALCRLASAALPSMLARQDGVAVTIGSIATERVIPGWHDYSAAKAMAGQFLTAFHKSNSAFGVRGLTVLSGLVATDYSAAAQGSGPAMLPEELADQVLHEAFDDRARSAVIIEGGISRRGNLGFHVDSAPAPSVPEQMGKGGTLARGADQEALGADGPDTRIASTVRRKLGLPMDADLSEGGVGITPGWDSLRHIELVLELESTFGIRFAAGEVEKILDYETLVQVVRRHLQ